MTAIPATAPHPNLDAMLEFVQRAHPGPEPETWTMAGATLVVARPASGPSTVYSVDHFDPTTKRLPAPVGVGDPDEIVRRYVQAAS